MRFLFQSVCATTLINPFDGALASDAKIKPLKGGVLAAAAVAELFTRLWVFIVDSASPPLIDFLKPFNDYLSISSLKLMFQRWAKKVNIRYLKIFLYSFSTPFNDNTIIAKIHLSYNLVILK